MLQPQSLGYRELWVARCSCCLWRGDHRVSHALDATGDNLSEQKSSFSSMMWGLWWQYQPTDLCCSLSLLSVFHAMGHNTCGWIKAVPYREHWRPEHSQGRVVVSFKAQHWLDLQHDSTSSCMQVMASAIAPVVRMHLCTVLNKVLALSLSVCSGRLLQLQFHQIMILGNKTS